MLLAVRAVTVAATAAGLGLALGGRALRWPRFPLVIEAAVAAVDHQPLLRRLLEDRIGTEATATVLELAMAAAHTVTLSPAALSVDLTIQALKAAECRAGARAWRRHEPQLALHADEPADQPQSLWPRPARSTQPVQRSVARFALIQALSAVLVGAGTRDADMAATATLVATPKPAGPRRRRSPRRSAKVWLISTRCCRYGRRVCADWIGSMRSSSTPACCAPMTCAWRASAVAAQTSCPQRGIGRNSF